MPQEITTLEIAKNRMITKIPIFAPDLPVVEVIQKLSKESWDSIDWVYVANSEKVLLGGVPIQRLLSEKKGSQLSEIMVKLPATVDPHTDQEKVAISAIENDLQQIPVTSKKGRLLGAVPSDQIIDILHDEHLEDLLRSTGVASAGFGIAQLVSERVTTLVKARLFWLLLGLAGGFVATRVVSFFEGFFLEEISLAFFIPVIVYMADAVGTQTQTIYIRTLTFAKVNFFKYLIREILVSGIISFFAVIILFAFAVIWLGNVKVPIIVSVSLFLTMSTAPILATGIPAVLNFFKKDPAIGSGPFSTILQDIASLVIYFIVVGFLL